MQVGGGKSLVNNKHSFPFIRFSFYIAYFHFFAKTGQNFGLQKEMIFI